MVISTGSNGDAPETVSPSKNGVGPPLETDETLLEGTLEPSTLADLLKAFGRVAHVGAGIFTPAGKRIGKPAHHSRFCRILYDSKSGKAACTECDVQRIEALKRGEGGKQYHCHAMLVDFCDPIICSIGGKKVLIGAFFAGQLRELADALTEKRVLLIRELAQKHVVDEARLVSSYVHLPRVAKTRIAQIRSWTRQFADLIASLVERKLAAQSELVGIIQLADDHSKVVNGVKDMLQADAVSIFLRNEDAPDELADRIFLVASTDPQLAARGKTVQDAISSKAASEPTIREFLLDNSYTAGQGLTGWVYGNDRIRHVPNVKKCREDPGDPSLPVWTHHVKEVPIHRAHAFLGAPIHLKDGTLKGVIRAVRPRKAGGFNAEQIQTFAGVASMVGAAVSKAEDLREQFRKVDSFAEAEGILAELEKPSASFDSVMDYMAGVLAGQLVPPERNESSWQTVYIVRHVKPTGHFRIVAASPDDFPDGPAKGFTIDDNDEKSVANRLLYDKDRKYVATPNVEKEGLTTAKGWTSLVSARIHDRQGKMWGTVALCGNGLTPEQVSAATPTILSFAARMEHVCLLTETFESKLSASAMLPLLMETHETFRILKNVESGLQNIVRKARPVGEGLSERAAMLYYATQAQPYIEEAVSWAHSCSELGRFLRAVTEQADKVTAVRNFREERRDKASSSTGEWAEFDLVGCVNDALESVRALAKDRCASIQEPLLNDGLVLTGDRNLVYRAVKNILENSLKHGCYRDEVLYAGRQVKVSLEVRGNNQDARIVIEDDGYGIPEAKLNQINGLYSNPTLVRHTGTPGYGSMIVAFAVAVHNGVARVRPISGEGSCTEITIPLDGGEAHDSE